MKVAGIVAEFDPFHNGHAYLIEHTRAEKEGGATHIVAVMSGHFTQRGAPAMTDPYRRAKAALLNGVDLVVELPLPWSLSSAQRFAQGSIFLLNALGAELIAFGSECGNGDALSCLADMLDSETVSDRLRGLLQTGLPYASAQRQAVGEVAGEQTAALLDAPNNTLGVEYLRAIRRIKSPMRPFTVKRLGALHDSMVPVGGLASASFIRELVRAGRVVSTAAYLPESVCRILTEAVQSGVCPSEEKRIERAVLAVLRALPKERWEDLPALSEGIENRLFHAARQAESLEALISLAKTKRYSRTRLQRLIWSAFLGITAQDSQGDPPYVHVIGASGAGLELLRRVRERGESVPMLTRASQAEKLDERGRKLFVLECRAADLFALALPKPPPCGAVQTAAMIRVP